MDFEIFLRENKSVELRGIDKFHYYLFMKLDLFLL